MKHGITALRRARKTDSNRIARATGATIVHRTDEIQPSDIGVAGLFEVRKIGDELVHSFSKKKFFFFTFFFLVILHLLRNVKMRKHVRLCYEEQTKM